MALQWLGQVGPSGQRRAELQRPYHRVAGRLVLDDLAGLVRGRAAAGAPDHVQVLAHVELGAQPVPHGSGLGRHPPQRAIGEHHGHVPDQHGSRLAEAPVLAEPVAVAVALHELAPHGRRAPAGVGAVHHVVVSQREGVEDLQGAAAVEGAVTARVPAAHQPAPVAVGGPDALASAEDHVGQIAEGLVEARVRVRPMSRRSAARISAEADLDPGRDGRSALREDSETPTGPALQPAVAAGTRETDSGEARANASSSRLGGATHAPARHAQGTFGPRPCPQSAGLAWQTVAESLAFRHAATFAPLAGLTACGSPQSPRFSTVGALTLRPSTAARPGSAPPGRPRRSCAAGRSR